MESFYKYKKFKKKFGSKYIKTVFSDNTFCITPKNSMYTYYYSENGNLIYIENQINEDKFIRYARYDINGNLDSVVLDVGNNEQFVFDVNKKLVAHWISSSAFCASRQAVVFLLVFSYTIIISFLYSGIIKICINF